MGEILDCSLLSGGDHNHTGIRVLCFCCPFCCFVISSINHHLKDGDASDQGHSDLHLSPSRASPMRSWSVLPLSAGASASATARRASAVICRAPELVKSTNPMPIPRATLNTLPPPVRK